MSELLNRRSTLDSKLAEVNTRIAEVSQAVGALDLLVGDGTTDQTELMLEVGGMNLADAVRAILRRSEVHLTPLEIMRKLRNIRFRITDYNNPQASISTMLRRLEESGQADTIIKDGKTAYRLIPEG
ncbi:MAG: hypothetical protein ACKVQW_06465 [Pyrinomonadaceae bacterium]